MYYWHWPLHVDIASHYVAPMATTTKPIWDLAKTETSWDIGLSRQGEQLSDKPLVNNCQGTVKYEPQSIQETVQEIKKSEMEGRGEQFISVC